jgi:hypothetical protein
MLDKKLKCRFKRGPFAFVFGMRQNSALFEFSQSLKEFPVPAFASIVDNKYIVKTRLDQLCYNMQ